MSFRDKNTDFRDIRDPDFGLQNALARYVRRSWPSKTVAYVEHHFGLTASAAKKVVDAQASRATLNEILRNPRHLALSLELVCDVAGTSMGDFITKSAEDARHERQQWDARQRALETLSTRLSDRDRAAGGIDV